MSQHQTKIFIVEDDTLLRNQLRDDLEEAGYWVIGYAADSDSAQMKLDTGQPDLVLMDIDIEGPLNGIQLAKIIKEKHKNTTVVFLTSHDDDMSFNSAAETSPFDYLTKPVSPRKLKRTIELAIQNQNTPSSPRNEWVIKDGSKLYKILYDDLLYVEAQDKYCLFQLKASKKELIRISLSSVIENLPAEMFFQLHRSFVVNLLSIEKFDGSESILTLKEGHNIPVSRKYKEGLIERMG